MAATAVVRARITEDVKVEASAVAAQMDAHAELFE
jgi:antitoxin component of RelBE/YafQ-DinJ toxin-antitoxin module